MSVLSVASAVARPPRRLRLPTILPGEDLGALISPALLRENKLPKLVRYSICTIAAAVFGFLLWSALTPIKEMARTEGQVIPFGYNRLVQHLEGGLVRDILVREGDFVKSGQTLMRLDGAGIEEDAREQAALVNALTLQAERLRALIEERDPDFAAAATAAPDQIAEQSRMHANTKEARMRERQVLLEQIEQKKRAIGRANEMVTTARANYKVSDETRGIYEKLANDKLTAHSNYLKALGDYNTRRGDVAALLQQQEGAQKELREYQNRLEALTAQQRDSAYADLHKVETDLARAHEEQKKLNGRVERLDVRAPVSGYVKGLKINTIGAVIPPGQTLMEIVPASEQLIVEVRILPEQIGRVTVGQDVQVKVDSFDYIRFGAVPGYLEFISATTFTNDATQTDFYKGRVRLAQNYVGPIPGRHPVVPGMTVDADIVTGEKSILAYLLRPIENALHNALTEK